MVQLRHSQSRFREHHQPWAATNMSLTKQRNWLPVAAVQCRTTALLQHSLLPCSKPVLNTLRALCERHSLWPPTATEQESVPWRLNEYAGWSFRVCVRVRLLRRESFTCGWGGWLSGHWGGGGGAASRSQSAPHMHVLICICSSARQFFWQSLLFHMPNLPPCCVAYFCQHTVFATHSTGWVLTGEAGGGWVGGGGTLHLFGRGCFHKAGVGGEKVCGAGGGVVQAHFLHPPPPWGWLL